jgi:hypothetical protein
MEKEYHLEIWQPIETAPKDGRNLLLGSLPDQWVCMGFYEKEGEWGWYETGSHWTDAHDGCVNPTDWQPCPEPPKH